MLMLDRVPFSERPDLMRRLAIAEAAFHETADVARILDHVTHHCGSARLEREVRAASLERFELVCDAAPLNGSARRVAPAAFGAA
jgi:hypothetical protein